MATAFPVRAIVGYRDGIPMWISVEGSPATTDQLYAGIVSKPKFEPCKLGDGTSGYRLRMDAEAYAMYNGRWDRAPSCGYIVAPGDIVALRYISADRKIMAGRPTPLPLPDPPRPRASAPAKPRGPGLVQVLTARLKAVVCYAADTIKAKKEEKDNASRFK